MVIKLYSHQEKALELAKPFKKVLFSLDLGLGKTFCCTEKMKTIPFKYALVVVPKSLVNQWCKHIDTHYPQWNWIDFTAKKRKPIDKNRPNVVVVNYDLIFRRPELQNLYHYDKNWVLVLDEAVAISNPSAKRTKTIMKMKCDNLIMLSGSVSKGHAENLYTLTKMLGWAIDKKTFWDNFIITKEWQNPSMRFPIKLIVGYKNQDGLKQKMRELGTIFMKAEDTLQLPEQTFIDFGVNISKEYKNFKKSRIIVLENGKELVGDCSLSMLLCERLLCGAYSKDKINAFRDLLESTDKRIIVFYNFWEEYDRLVEVVKDLNRPLSEVNGRTRDLENYENCDDSVTLVNYAAGSSGLNLQKANIMIYFTPPLSVEFATQSAKRIHRIGTTKPCVYYRMICENSVEEKIYESLKKGKDFIDYLYEE